MQVFFWELKNKWSSFVILTKVGACGAGYFLVCLIFGGMQKTTEDHLEIL